MRTSLSEELRRALDHAERLGRVLQQLESVAQRGSAMVGLGGLLALDVKRAVGDGRRGATTAETLARVMAAVDEAHRRAGAGLGRRPIFDCCREEEAITVVPEPDVITLIPRGEEVSAGAVPIDDADTLVEPWEEPPEVLARVENGDSLVRRVARRIVGELGDGVVGFEDLCSFGRVGLLLAARTFDERRGGPFEAWARIRIRGAMIDGLRTSGRLGRRSREKLKALEAVKWAEAEREAGAQADAPKEADRRMAAQLGVTAHKVTEALSRQDEAVSVVGYGEDVLAREEIRRLLGVGMNKLPNAERELLERFFLAEETIEQAGAALGLTKGQANYRLSTALQRLGGYLSEAGVDIHTVRELLARRGAAVPAASVRAASQNDSTVG